MGVYALYEELIVHRIGERRGGLFFPRGTTGSDLVSKASRIAALPVLGNRRGRPPGHDLRACIGLNFSPAPSGCDTFGLRRNAAAAQESGSLLAGKILG